MRIRTIALPLAALLVAAIGVASGCSKKNVSVDSLGNTVGEVVRYDGTLSLRGSHPYPQLVLETKDGAVIHIQSKTLQAELKSLQGMHVSLEGEVLTPMEKTYAPVMDALRYDMLRLPTGELPLVGTVMVIDGDCILTERTGRRYWMRGDLVPILREYEGERVWVVGTKGAAPNPPQNTTPYWVTGYGVLGQPAAGM
jgi:hypothetical protein